MQRRSHEQVSQQDDDLNLVAGPSIPVNIPLVEPLELLPKSVHGKGKEIALLIKDKPLNAAHYVDYHHSDAGSSFLDVDESSVAGPVTGVVENSAAVRAIAVPVTTRTDMTSFSLPSSYHDVVMKALKEIHLMFLVRLKDASLWEVEGVAARACESYDSIRYLRGDPTPLRRQVDAYVEAVNSFLSLERAREGRYTSGQVEQLVIAQRTKIDRAKASVNKILLERIAAWKAHSSAAAKVESLQTELKNACEEVSRLQDEVEDKDHRMSTLNANINGMEEGITELGARPTINAAEEADFQRQKAHLEELRASLDISF